MRKLLYWTICLDLTQIDDLLLGYIRFLSTITEPEKIEFLHVYPQDESPGEANTQTAGAEEVKSYAKKAEELILDKVHKHLDDFNFSKKVVIKQGNTPNTIFQHALSENPDLLVLGKKIGFEGNGNTGKQITKYVPSSVLFVPETGRSEMRGILSLADFTEESAFAVQMAKNFSSASNTPIKIQHIYPAKTNKLNLARQTQGECLEFIEKHSLSGDINFVLTEKKYSKKADHVNEEVVKQGVDLLVMGSKNQINVHNVNQKNFVDEMITYPFATPLLIAKNDVFHKEELAELFEKQTGFAIKNL